MRFFIVAYYFCNERAIGGKRWRDMASLLHDHGDLTVFCADGRQIADERISVIQVPDGTKGASERNGFVERPHNNAFMRAAFHVAQSFLFWPDRQKWWARKAVHQLGRLNLRPDDVIITSGPRFSVHWEMRRWLQGQPHSLFWAMDLRDPWTNDPSPAMRRRTPAWLTKIERRMEAACHERANLVTTVSNVMTRMMHRDFGSQAVTIYNGYPEQMLSGRLAEVSGTDALDICYLGSIIHGLRSPSLLFQAARNLGSATGKLRFHFWCNDPNLVSREASANGALDLVECHPAVGLTESIRIQRQAGANLVLNGIDDNANHMITGKVFELLAAHRPVVAVTGPNSELREILEGCGCNGIVWNPETAETTLRRLLNGALNPVSDPERKFSRRAAVQKFLEAVIAARPREFVQQSS